MKISIILLLLFANTCSFSQSVGIGTANPNANAIVEIKDSARGLIIPRMDSIHRKNIANTKGMMVYDTSTSSFWFNNGIGWKNVTGTGCNLTLGDTYGGGIIFYLDASGCHGLVCATTDQSSGIAYSNGGNTNGAFSDGIGSGRGNSMLVRPYPADNICLNYTGGGFDDWYLPSRYELNLMYLNLHLAGLGTFAYNYYWSSTEFDPTNAWNVNFYNGLQSRIYKATLFRVRAVRYF